MKISLKVKASALFLLLTVVANAMPLPPVPQNIYRFCLNRGFNTWGYNNPSSSLVPISIYPLVDLAGYSMEISHPLKLTINVRITSGGTAGSIAPFNVVYEDLASDLGNIIMSIKVSEAQVAHFSQALNSISFADTHMSMMFTVKDPSKPLSEANTQYLEFHRQTDRLGTRCLGDAVR
jgi:hypothetical protein